ncbi:MAG: hypothetical protein JNK54_08115 [Elusimicrobia bacterium]|jgi:hypothetical protein|nr:hypothetical protein [Elusimicrobiota bacterium]
MNRVLTSTLALVFLSGAVFAADVVPGTSTQKKMMNPDEVTTTTTPKTSPPIKSQSKHKKVKHHKKVIKTKTEDKGMTTPMN